MTKEEAKITLANLKRYMSGGGVVDKSVNKAIDMAIEALSQPEQHYPSWYAEQIKELPPAQPKRGKWIKKHRHYGGFRSYTGFDAIGEQHTITVDERTEYDDLYCSECGARSADNFLNFCPNCGADMRGEQDG